MEREIEKGSCPLQFEYLEFGEKPFQFIESEEKLNEVLSYLLRLGEYRGYTEHLVGNNVYMDKNPSRGMRFNPNYKPKTQHRELREFTVKGKKVMAYSKKDAITRLKHSK